jgi:hypothetical protein
MGKGGHVKVMKKKIGGDDQDISRMFNEMMNSDQVNVNIAWPKYSSLIDNIEEFVKIFVLLRRSTIIRRSDNPTEVLVVTDYSHHGEEIDNFLKTNLAQFEEFKNAPFNKAFTGTLNNLNEFPEDLVKDFRTKYASLKKFNMINAMQVICAKLLDYRNDIEDISRLDINFIERMAGVEFRPYPFTTMDYKDIFLDDSVDDKAKKYLLLILNKVFHITYNVYNIVSSPDIDVDEFVDVIINNLDKLKKAPGLDNCDKAFRKIRQSAELLKSKFTTYYRDLEETNSPTIMMENFILDVAQETDADPQTMMQFKKIIAYYRKATAGQRGKDPKIDMLFSKVDEHFKRYDDAVKSEGGVVLEETDDVTVNASKCTGEKCEKECVCGNASIKKDESYQSKPVQTGRKDKATKKAAKKEAKKKTTQNATVTENITEDTKEDVTEDVTENITMDTKEDVTEDTK